MSDQEFNAGEALAVGAGAAAAFGLFVFALHTATKSSGPPGMLGVLRADVEARLEELLRDVHRAQDAFDANRGRETYEAHQAALATYDRYQRTLPIHHSGLIDWAAVERS